MKKHTARSLGTALLALAAWALSAQSAPQAVSGATPEAKWSIALAGARKDSLVESYYEKLYNAGAVTKTVERKGVKATYKGVPLSKIVAMVDGADSGPNYAFDEALWKAGYEITLVAKDGYAKTFSTKEVAPEALMVAVWADGKWIAPMTVGDTASGLWVKDLASIETSLAPNPALAAPAFSIEIEAGGATASFTLEELEASDLYLEGTGSYTTSAGTKYTNVYGGAKLLGLIERFTKLSAEDSVTFVAMDGYEMTYPGSQVLDQKDGTWILAFEMDGARIPKDPGYVRTVKVGPANPNIDGHNSVRMVRRLVVKQKDFKPFSLKLEGKMGFELDRATVQSCVSCHKRTVTYEAKGKTAVYTGFPAYLALGYVDDPKYAPHKQDKSLAAYDEAAAKAGYKVVFAAADGFKVTLDSRELNRNEDVIIAMYKDEAILPEGEFPLALAWDRGAKLVPAGIKGLRHLASIRAEF